MRSEGYAGGCVTPCATSARGGWRLRIPLKENGVRNPPRFLPLEGRGCVTVAQPFIPSRIAEVEEK